MKTNHLFIDWDGINTYLKRCVPTKVANGMEYTRSVTVCMCEYRYKKQNKTK